MNQEQEYLIKELEKLLYQYSYYEYNEYYSTSDNTWELNSLKCMISSILSVCHSLGVSVWGITGEYCGNVIEAKDFQDSDELMKYW